MKQQHTIKVWQLLLLIAAVALSIFMYAKYIENVQTKHVYDTCQASRTADTITEDECWRAQLANKLEYICHADNTSINTKCWVEHNADLSE